MGREIRHQSTLVVRFEVFTLLALQETVRERPRQRVGCNCFNDGVLNRSHAFGSDELLTDADLLDYAGGLVENAAPFDTSNIST